MNIALCNDKLVPLTTPVNYIIVIIVNDYCFTLVLSYMPICTI